jgi:hypothetical protein
MDLETYISVESTSLTVAGIILSLAVSKKWLILPLATSLFSLANVTRGRKNPVFWKLGFRTREEIEKEKYALKAIRGDFKYLLDVPNAVWNAVNR